MDIFEEIKEAVLASTPGEDTRNFYRNQGVQLERDRIIKLLEALTETRPIETNTNYWGYSFERVIALIKGDNNA